MAKGDSTGFSQQQVTPWWSPPPEADPNNPINSNLNGTNPLQQSMAQIRNAIKQYTGRDASDQEVLTYLGNGQLNSQQSVNYAINNIRNSQEGRNYGRQQYQNYMGAQNQPSLPSSTGNTPPAQSAPNTPAPPTNTPPAPTGPSNNVWQNWFQNQNQARPQYAGNNTMLPRRPMQGGFWRGNFGVGGNFGGGNSGGNLGGGMNPMGNRNREV